MRHQTRPKRFLCRRTFDLNKWTVNDVVAKHVVVGQSDKQLHGRHTEQTHEQTLGWDGTGWGWKGGGGGGGGSGRKFRGWRIILHVTEDQYCQDWVFHGGEGCGRQWVERVFGIWVLLTIRLLCEALAARSLAPDSRGISAEVWKFFFDLSEPHIWGSLSLWIVKTIAVPPHTKRGSNGLQKMSKRTVYHLK